MFNRRVRASSSVPTHRLRTVFDPLPQLHTGNLSRRSVLHEVVDRDTAIARDPRGAVREGAEVSAGVRRGAFQAKQEGGKSEVGLGPVPPHSRRDVVAHALLGDFAGDFGVGDLLVGDDDVLPSDEVLRGQRIGLMQHGTEHHA